MNGKIDWIFLAIQDIINTINSYRRIDFISIINQCFHTSYDRKSLIYKAL